MDESASDCCWFHNMQGKEREQITWVPTVYYVVERVVSMDGQETGIYIPDKARRAPETYYLQLRGEAAKNKGAQKDFLFVL
jgi:hypothetical protein